MYSVLDAVFCRIQTWISHSLYLKGFAVKCGRHKQIQQIGHELYKCSSFYRAQKNGLSSQSFSLLPIPPGNEENLRTTLVRREKETTTEHTHVTSNPVKPPHPWTVAPFLYFSFFFSYALLCGELQLLTSGISLSLKTKKVKRESAQLW